MVSMAGSRQQMHSMSTSITQGPPDLAAVAAAAAAADSRRVDSSAVNSSRIGGSTSMDVIPRPLRASGSSNSKGVLEASVNNFANAVPMVKPSNVEVDVEERPAPACCLFPCSLFSRKKKSSR